MQYLIINPCAEVREEKKRPVEFPGQKQVEAVTIQRPAILHQNHTNRCFPCQNGTANNPQAHWRCKATIAPQPDWWSQPTPEATPSLPRTPPALPGDNVGAQSSHIHNLAPRYVCSHALLPNAQFFKLDSFAEDSLHDTEYTPDMLNDEVTSTG